MVSSHRLIGGGSSLTRAAATSYTKTPRSARGESTTLGRLSQRRARFGAEFERAIGRIGVKENAEGRFCPPPGASTASTNATVTARWSGWQREKAVFDVGKESERGGSRRSSRGAPSISALGRESGPSQPIEDTHEKSARRVFNPWEAAVSPTPWTTCGAVPRAAARARSGASTWTADRAVQLAPGRSTTRSPPPAGGHKTGYTVTTTGGLCPGGCGGEKRALMILRGLGCTPRTIRGSALLSASSIRSATSERATKVPST